ncbi:MAG: IMP cyclohydrolase [Candidatus Woesearchaeota archaeon]
MQKTLMDVLKDFPYLGRFVLIGVDLTDTFNFIACGIQGRSPPSRERYYEESTDRKTLSVKPLAYDKMVREFQGGNLSANPELLLYNVIKAHLTGVAVSNGKQTDSIADLIQPGQKPKSILERGLSNWSYESDPPNNTPRVNGVVNDNQACLAILKKDKDGSRLPLYFNVPMTRGRGMLLPTYTGVNMNPLPSFQGEPLELELTATTPTEMVLMLYGALVPQSGDDLRVAVGAMFQNRMDFSTMLYSKSRYEKPVEVK